jgi:hypothetical protein
MIRSAHNSVQLLYKSVSTRSWRALGFTNRMSSPATDGITYAKCHCASGSTIIRQYPSARSIFEKWMCSSGDTLAMKSKSLGNTLPSSLTGASGASRSVMSLTDGCSTASLRWLRLRPRPDFPRLTAKDKSRIMRPKHR